MVESVNSFTEEGLTSMRSRDANKNMQEITKELGNLNNDALFSRSAQYLTALLTTVLLATTTPTLGQSGEKKGGRNLSIYDKRHENLLFVAENVKKYFPDMESFVQQMEKKFMDQTHADKVNELLTTMLENIPQGSMTEKDRNTQKVGAILGIFERIFNKSDFYNAHPTTLTKETITQIKAFMKAYMERWKGYMVYVAQRTEELKIANAKLDEQIKVNLEKLKQTEQKTEQVFKNIEQMMENTTEQDIQNNPSRKALVQETKALYQEAKKEATPHMKKLFDLVP